MNVDTSDTIGILKAKIAAKEKIPAARLVLIFAGKVLTDGTTPHIYCSGYVKDEKVTVDQTVEESRIEKESCVHVVQRAEGQVAPSGERTGRTPNCMWIGGLNVDLNSVTNKIYDINVSEKVHSDEGTRPPLLWGLKVDSPPGYDEKKNDPSAQIFIKSFDGRSKSPF